KGGVILDTKAGLRAVLMPGKPDESRIVEVLSYEDPVVQMPPKGKLPDGVLSDIKLWIAGGAIDPRDAAPAVVASASPQYKGMSLEDGRKWWAFQPVAVQTAPKLPSQPAASNKIDSFILGKLAENKLKPSPAADKRTLVTRAYVDLVGYKPNFQEVQAFVSDKAPGAYGKLVDRLMASPQ